MAIDQASRLRPETLKRIGDLAKYVLMVGLTARLAAAPDQLGMIGF